MLIKKIVIASVLKPVNDARMYEKIGRSLAEESKYEVHIIGYPATIPVASNIIFHPLKKFSRLSLGRIRAYWNISKIICKVKPEVLIVNTHEILIVSIIFKIIFGLKILYDIQENYFRNIWYQSNYPPIIKHLIAVVVRSVELISMPFIDHKLLAESKYRKELSFSGKNSTEILNKYNPIKKLSFNRKSDLANKIRFLYSGTVAKVYGIEDALRFITEVNKHINSTLTIIGHCPNIELFNSLKEASSNNNNILLKISLTPVDHEKIIEEYDNADIALTPYLPSKSTKNCIPAKFYEYTAHRLPIIISNHNPYWIDFLSGFEGFIAIDYNKFDPKEVITSIISKSFYPSKIDSSIFWNEEKGKLLQILAKIF